VDISAAGKLLFSGQAAMETGRPLFFIGGGDLDGTKQRYFSTGDYRASQVVAADDGSIWAIGAERATISTDDAGKRTTQWSNYDMLRHYTASGALQEHFLPRWEGNVAHWARTEDAAGNATWAAQDRDGLPTTTTLDQASSGVRDGWKTSRQVFLRSSGTVTVLYDAIQDRICKSDATANTFACKSVSDTATDMMSITGFALFPNGDILASMKSDGPNRNALRGLYRLAPRTDGSGVKWSPVSGSLNNSVAPDNFLYLLGTDGNSLVYRRQGDKLNVTTLYESVW
jgi:hypothetical protein